MSNLFVEGTIDYTFVYLLPHLGLLPQIVLHNVEMEERHRLTITQYTNKLLVEGVSLPDPFSLESKSWSSETKGGMLHWPSLYYLDISKFLDHINTPKDLLHRLDCEYKEGKGYRYFSSSFAKEIFWHPIRAIITLQRRHKTSGV